MKPDLRAIFCEAMELQSPAEVRRYLDEVCGDDESLRNDVLSLLKSHDVGGKFLGGRELSNPIGVSQGSFEGAQIGPYKIREKIGEGGMGEVYVAQQTEPVRRKVAIKVIKPGMDSREVIARFEAERQALALMDHPNIAKVLDGGSTENGHPYFVMELVRGTPIIEYCDKQKLTTQQRLDLFAKVCHAIQHAHQKGIIHRDIKPSNVLITLHDGVPVPRVIDFGIAKAIEQELTEKTIYTRHHQFVGTPAYMSPEQAEMSGLGIDTRSDIYSLGVLLYELLTGVTPFNEKQLLQSGIDEMRRIIREQEPLRPSSKFSTLQQMVQSTTAARRAIESPKLISLLSGDLDWIVMKCLEKDRSRRYDTATDLASDITRHLNDEPVVARPPTTAYQLQKAWRRNRGIYTAGCMVVASLLVGISLSVWQAREAEAARRRESVLRKAAEAGERTQRQIAYSADMKRGQEYLRQHNRAELERLLARYLPKPGEDDLRGIEWRHLRQTAAGDETYTFPHETEVRSISLSEDGSRLASITMSGKVRLFDVGKRKVLLQSGGGQMSFGVQDGSVTLSPNGQHLAAVQQGVLKVWNAVDGAVFEEELNVAAPICFSPDSQYLAGATAVGLRIWKTNDWSNSILLETNTSNAQALAFTPDSKRILFSPSRFASRLVVYSLGRQRTEGELTGLTNPHVICTDGSIAVAGGRDGNIAVWNLANREVVRTFKAHRSIVIAVALSPDGKTLASGGNESEIRLWDTKTFEAVGDLKGHHSQVWNLKFSGDGRLLASASMDQSVKLWDWRGKEETLRTSISLDTVKLEPKSTTIKVRDKSEKATNGRRSETPRIYTVNAGDSIQAAVDAAMPGDRIHLSAGIHEISETIRINKPLIIGGAGGNQDNADLPTVLKGVEGLPFVLRLDPQIGAMAEVQSLKIETGGSGIQHIAGDFALRNCQVIVRSTLNFQKVISLDSRGIQNRPTDTVTLDACNLSAEYVGDTTFDTPPDVDIVLTAPNARYVEIAITNSNVTNEIPNRISNGIETRGTTAHLTIEDNRVRCQGMGLVFANHIGTMDIRGNAIYSTCIGIVAGTESSERSNISGNQVTIQPKSLQVYPERIREFIAETTETACIAIGSTSSAVATAFFKVKVIGRGTNFWVEKNILMGNPSYGILLMDSPEPESFGPPTPNDSHDNVISLNDFTELNAEWDIALGASTFSNLIVDNIGGDSIWKEAGNDDRNIINAD